MVVAKRRHTKSTKQVEISIKKSASSETPTGDIKIAFSRLIEDSRCPKNAVCIWAGRVSAEFILDGEKLVQLSLGDLRYITLVPKVNSITYKSYTIELLDADFGVAANQGEENKYTVKIMVSE